MAKYKRQLRISQAVTTFGPGAVVDLRQESVMMAGTDFWPDDGPVDIHEPNLERALRVERFRMPAPNDEHPGKDLPFVVFPRWMVCPNCNRLAWESFFRGIDGGNGPLKCPACYKRVYPARLIVACNRGHIDDFPWVWWAHRGDQEKKCEKPELFLRARGRTASLADLELSCRQCGASTTLAGATQQESLRGLTCSGRRPWLQDEELCGQSIVCLQRGASNVYFSQSTSSISIPPWSRGIHALLNRHWLTLRAVPDHALAETVTGLNLPALLKLPVADVVQAIIDRKAETGGSQIQITESELRYREFQALSRDMATVGDYDDFKTRRTTVDPQLNSLIQ
jgi:hypothetical protein